MKTGISKNSDAIDFFKQLVTTAMDKNQDSIDQMDSRIRAAKFVKEQDLITMNQPDTAITN